MVNYLILLSIFFFFTAAAPASSSTDLPKATAFDHVITLGGDCQVTYQLKRRKLIDEYLGFEWLLSEVKDVIELITNNFEDFLNPDNVKLIFNPDKPASNCVFDNRYKVRLIHDYPLNPSFMDKHDEIKEKYDRRFDRFKEIVATAQKDGQRILFVRKRSTKIEAAALAQALREHYPTLNFLLLIVDGSEETKTLWDIPNVINRHLRQLTPYSWKGDDEAWDEILGS